MHTRAHTHAHALDIRMISDVVRVKQGATLRQEKPNEQVYFMILRCSGGGANGETGANCNRVALRTGWCGGGGSCESGCTWYGSADSAARKNTQLLHMCGVKVKIVVLASQVCPATWHTKQMNFRAS